MWNQSILIPLFRSLVSYALIHFICVAFFCLLFCSVFSLFFSFLLISIYFYLLAITRKWALSIWFVDILMILVSIQLNLSFIALDVDCTCISFMATISFPKQFLVWIFWILNRSYAAWMRMLFRFDSFTSALSEFINLYHQRGSTEQFRDSSRWFDQ